MHRAHRHTGPSRHARLQTQPIELQPLVAQRVALVHVDHHTRQATHVVDRREAWPRQRVTRVERLDAVAVLAAVVVQVEEDAVVLDARREPLLRPFAGDVGAQRVQAGDESDVAVAQQLHPGGEREVATAALARDHHSRRIDLQVGSVGHHPLQTRHTVVQAGRVGLDLGHRRGRHRVAEVHHRHGHVVVGDNLAPRPVVAVEARHGRHAAAVDVVDARHHFIAHRADEVDVDGVAVGLRRHLVLGDGEALARHDRRLVARLHHRLVGLLEHLVLGGRSLGHQLVAAAHVDSRDGRHHRQQRLQTRVDSRVVGNVVRHGAPSGSCTGRP